MSTKKDLQVPWAFFQTKTCLEIQIQIQGSAFNPLVGYRRYVIGHLFLELGKKQDTLCEAKSLFDATVD